MSDSNLNDASFTPEINDSEESTNKQTYSATGSFRFWCQKVLPLVYDDSLSYYELLCKVVNYLNGVIQNVDNLNTSVDNTNTAFENLQNYVNTTKDTLVEVYGELEQYVNDYFNNLDVQEEINSKLDSMAEDGSLSTIISPFIPAAVSDWLSNNITPTSPAIDASLSVSGAGADAKVTGNLIRTNASDLKSTLSAFNFINLEDYVKNGYIRSNGELQINDDWRTIYMIPVESQATVALIGNFGLLKSELYNVNCYDKNKKYLGGVWRADSQDNYSVNIRLIPETEYICATIEHTFYDSKKATVFATPIIDSIPQKYVDMFLQRAIAKQSSVILSIDYTNHTFNIGGNGYIFGIKNIYNISSLEERTVSIATRTNYTFVVYIRNNILHFEPFDYIRETDDLIIAELYISNNIIRYIPWILDEDEKNLANAFNLKDCIVQGFIADNGEINTRYSNWRTLYMLPISETDKLILKGNLTAITIPNTYNITCFDANKQYLGGVFVSEDNVQYYYQKITLISGTEFVCISTTEENIDNACALINCNSLYKLPINIIRSNEIESHMPNVAFSAFQRFGVIGDSLSVGWTGNDDQRNIDFSWGQVLARKYGVKCSNFGKSGATTKTWFSEPFCYEELIKQGNKCQSYIVGIGTNDVIKNDFPIGTIADVNMQDSSQNADSFCGWYGKIIQTIKAVNPTAKIFCYTIPYPRIDINKNNAIRSVVELFDNTYLVDLAEKYDIYYKSEHLTKFAYEGHFSSSGYANIAELTMYILSQTMIDNPSEFINIDNIPYDIT